MSSIIVVIIALLIGIPIGAIAINAVWSATDQIVDISNNSQLKTSYQTGKTMINTAEEVKDNYAFLKSITALVLIIGIPASIIKAING